MTTKIWSLQEQTDESWDRGIKIELFIKILKNFDSVW